jgi:hypothetical protein
MQKLKSKIYKTKHLQKLHSLTKEPLIKKWFNLNNEAYQRLLDNYNDQNFYINHNRSDRNRIDGCVFVKNEDYTLILFIAQSRLSYHDLEPALLLYEAEYDKKKSFASANIYRLQDGDLQLTCSSKSSQSVKRLEEGHLKFYVDTYAEMHVEFFHFDEHLSIEIKDKFGQGLFNFATIELSEDVDHKLSYYLDLLTTSLEVDPKIRRMAENNVFQILSFLVELEDSSLLKQSIVAGIKANTNTLIACYALYESLVKKTDLAHILIFLEKMWQEIDPALLAAIKTAARHEKKAKERGFIWAYRIPQLIDKVVTKFLPKYHPKKHSQYKGKFIELDLDPSTVHFNAVTGLPDCNYGELIPAVDEYGHPRVMGQNKSGIVIGLKIDDLNIGKPVKRLLIIGDLTCESKGTISAHECVRLNAALHYATLEGIPIDWFPASFGVEISQVNGIENLDASASTAREIIKCAHMYREKVTINIVVNLVNIGAQSYWNALASILMDTKGVLIMTETGSMALTGHKAWLMALKSLTHSLDIESAANETYPEGLKNLGGYSNIYGPNSEAMAYTPNLEAACELLIRHHYFSYMASDEKLVSLRGRKDENQIDSPIALEILRREILNIQKGKLANREAILEALRDPDSPPSLKWWLDAKGIKVQRISTRGCMGQEPHTIVQEMMIGSQPTMVIFPPSGSLTPADSGIIAHAIYKASGQLPVLIIVNLTGFNCDPLSMENQQLSLGASICQAIVEHQGPITVVNLGYLIGGTFVVFSKQLNPLLKLIAVEGAHIQVVGGKVAAKVVFHHRILQQAKKDPRLDNLFDHVDHSLPGRTFEESQHRILANRDEEKHSDYEIKLRKIMEELESEENVSYDALHNEQRALKVGAIDAIVSYDDLKKGIVQVQEQSIDDYMAHFLHPLDYKCI